MCKSRFYEYITIGRFRKARECRIFATAVFIDYSTDYVLFNTVCPVVNNRQKGEFSQPEIIHSRDVSRSDNTFIRRHDSDKPICGQEHISDSFFSVLRRYVY